ncbi:MAG: hypothetical protein CVU56_10025 [Deltaproteobacteria bacterium HGW-Deltaproteobacteria-14]|jgi:glycerol-1-phosphate dehydrogenase [NAD(P)+]|nr:MAG: hypothetical protein CVU56_10025 [Deltaproteobacteria bacterium HGW-Deltaproteobacteria-14]
MTTLHPALDRLLAAARADRPAGRTRWISLRPGAVEDVAGWLDTDLPDAEVVLVADAHTYEAAGEALEARLGDAGRTVRRLVLEPRPGDDHLVCEDGVIRALQTILAAHPVGLPIAVGAGTVNDTVKMAAHALDRDYAVVPTAASMNGYTSLIGAVLVGGVKRTLPARQPVAIFADLDVLTAAPPVLNQAGFGDLLSKPYSDSDWILSHLVRDVPYDSAPAELLDEVFRELLDKARAVGRADRDGIRVLMEAILLSGFSMTIAGSSAPASGGEHLVSHYWDMEQLHHGRPLFGLHGTQVGVATRASALLFERLIALDGDAIDVDAAVARRPDDRWLASLGAVHDTLSAEIVAEITDQLGQKQRHGAALRAELTRVKAGWPDLRARLAASLMPAARITQALREAGCADRASAIGVDLDHMVKTLRVCRHIRSRYVALDLMDDLGLLDGWAAEVARELETA